MTVKNPRAFSSGNASMATSKSSSLSIDFNAININGFNVIIKILVAIRLHQIIWLPVKKNFFCQIETAFQNLKPTSIFAPSVVMSNTWSLSSSLECK